mgnify:CR=1 FL=1
MLTAPFQDEIGGLELQYSDVLAVFNKIDAKNSEIIELMGSLDKIPDEIGNVAFQKLKFDTFQRLGQIKTLIKNLQDSNQEQRPSSGCMEQNDEKIS